VWKIREWVFGVRGRDQGLTSTAPADLGGVHPITDEVQT
jgi:hypothetical protein